jgi:hypothetical protein
MNEQIETPVSRADFVELQRLATELPWPVDMAHAQSISDPFIEMDVRKPLDGDRFVLSHFRAVADGADKATGVVYVTLCPLEAEEGLSMPPFVMGVCTDRYVRTPRGWKISSRTFEPRFAR